MEKEADLWLIEYSKGMPVGSRYTFSEVVGCLESYSASLLKENEELKATIIEKDKECERLKAEWDLSEKAHTLTTEQLMNTQKSRNDWHEMADKLANEMRRAEWDSPLYWEYKKLWAYYHTGDA